MKNRRAFEFRLGKLGLILFASGMSLMLFTLFLIGVVVGKHMEAYPERYATGILEMITNRIAAALPEGEKAAPQEGEAAARGEAQRGSVEGGPTDQEPGAEKPGGGLAEAPLGPGKEGKADKGPTLSPDLPAPRVTLPAAKAGETSRPGAASGPEPAGKRPSATADAKAVETAAKKQPGPEAAPPLTPQKGRYEVQVAAYREKAQADRLVKRVAQYGYTSEVVLKEIPGKGQWFRVIVMGLESRDKAKDAADLLTEKIGGLNCVIRASGKPGNGQ